MRVKHEPSDVRRTGRTTEQILSAPPEAAYVCPNKSIVEYVRDMARRLGRSDIRVYGPYALEQDGMVLRGRFRPIVVDHACDLTQSEAAVVADLNRVAR